MTIASTASPKRINCASSTPRLRPEALNTTVIPIAAIRHSADEQRTIQMQCQQQARQPVSVRCVREESSEP